MNREEIREKYNLEFARDIGIAKRVADDFESKEQQTEKEFSIHLAKTIESIRGEFENRTCGSCEYFEKAKEKQFQYVGMCSNTETCCPIHTKKDFGCNKWKQK